MSTTSTKTSRPLRADAERNRRRILAAAREVFARRGLEAGLDEIAREAGVGTGTVYRRFPDKDALVAALFADRFDEIETVVRAGLAADDAWTGLVQMLTSLTELQIADHGLCDVMYDPARKAAFGERWHRLTPLIGAVVERAKRAGALRADVELTDFALLQMGLTRTAALCASVEPQLWRRYLVLALDGLRADGNPRSPLPVPALDTARFERACDTMTPQRR